MHLESWKLGGQARVALGALLSLFIAGFAGSARGAEGLVPFDGEKSSWHGFDRYDFLMDETDLTIKPYKVGPDEGNAAKAQVKGQRQCIVVVPKTAAPGNPWSWRGCYWDHQPQAEVELLKRGFHIAFVAPDAGAQGKVWDTWYKFLTERHGLAKKAAFIGMSKGGVNEFNWGVVNPDKVACIYADNPALYDEDFAKLPELAKHDVPLLHICGSEDFLLQRHTRAVEDTYHRLGGLITVIVKEGDAHHPHSLQNAKPIADWIEQHMAPSTANRPAFVDATFTKGYYYSLEPSFIYLKEEDTYATARGPGFTECYDRYDGPTSGKFRMGGMSIIVPKTVAPGKPWVFTGDPIERDATVEQALLAKGCHILVVSPMGSGMTQKQWDDAYKLLVDNGFSKKPVLKGTGAMAGEAYAWAEANPDKVSCIYARNPLMKSLMAGKQEQPIDNLAALAKAGVPVLHDCGALDPWLGNQTRVVEKRYQDLGGKITVIVREGEGHFPLSPKDPKSVVDFILSHQQTKGTEPKTTPLVGSQVGIGQYWQVDYPASTVEGELKIAVTYTLWIPDGVKQLRGVIVHQHGAGTTASKEGSTAAYDLHWQALAKKWDCALLGPSYHVLNEKTDLTPGGSELWFDPRRGSEKTFLKALGELAAKSGHPELETVPWALWGHSGGGIWADVLSTLHPDRVVAIWLRSGSAAMFRTRDEFPQPEIPAAVYAIPIMVNPGVKEKDPKIPDVKGKEKGVWWGNLATFREYRAEGAPIGFAPDPRTGHECGDSRYLAIPFFDACLAMRLPDKGSKDQTLKPVDMSKAWLAPVLGDTAQPAAEFKGNAKEAVWLPNEAVAKAWMEYVKTGAVSDTTPPPAPFNVQATAKADQGTEIVWNAEADFESGIGGFIVLRDGQELAKAPQTPVGKFGRPLFQSMTYHDTPAQPLAQMRYVDASSKPGENHTYTIIAVNSVGLKSEPSASSAPQKARPPQTPPAQPIPVKGDAPTSLYGGGAASAGDCVKKQAGDSFRWTGSGQITWKVQVDRAGDYEVVLCHAAEPGAVGQHLQVSSGDSSVGYTLAKTKGVLGDKSYEMTPIKGRLHLEAGAQSITLSIPNAPKAMDVLQFRSLELIPVAAKAAIEADRQEAKRARASTEWMAKAGYGLMFHWTSQSVGKDGTHKPYAQAVDDFDVKRFAEMVDETGAGYVILTIGHAESYCPAPLKAWEKYHPGKTTRRDLIAEMADALNAKGIKLMCYLNAASLGKYPKADEEEFTQIMTEVLTEFGERYKEKVAGYWIDCCYQAKEKYPGFSFREFFKACKAGNPNRIVALNSWIYPNVSEWQEYWAGETASPVGLPLDGTTQEDGPGAGLRYHALLIMEPYWVQDKVEMPKPRFTAEQLGDYIGRCKANGGAVTINLGIYQDGTVDPNAVDVLKEVRKRVR